jgi:hypothetical protein
MFRCFWGLGFFDNQEGLLARKQTSFPITLHGIKLISTSIITPITYLGNWNFVVLVIATWIMINPRPFLLEALAQVENNTFPFH